VETLLSISFTFFLRKVERETFTTFHMKSLFSHVTGAWSLIGLYYYHDIGNKAATRQRQFSGSYLLMRPAEQEL
jgi:hypothetical protein